jgi:hypothetical protein
MVIACLVFFPNRPNYPTVGFFIIFLFFDIEKNKKLSQIFIRKMVVGSTLV